MPTEAEWEYAARAGTTLATYNGDLDGDPDDCGTSAVLDPIAWWCGNGYGSNYEVGTRIANPWGLYDMLGNDWEWCHDAPAEYSEDAVVDPWGADSGEVRVYRGGSWYDRQKFLRSALRYWCLPDLREDRRGLRPVRSIPYRASRSVIITPRPLPVDCEPYLAGPRWPYATNSNTPSTDSATASRFNASSSMSTRSCSATSISPRARAVSIAHSIRACQ